MSRKLQIRPAVLADISDVFEWRNDDLSIKMAFRSEGVDWDNHVTWFESVLESEKSIILICELVSPASKKIGMVRFDFYDGRKKARVSIILSKPCRAKGYARECLRLSLEKVRADVPSLFEIQAEIKNINVASIRTFESVGFNRISEESRDLLRYALKLRHR